MLEVTSQSFEPLGVALACAPNPFNPMTTTSYTVPAAGQFVELDMMMGPAFAGPA